MKASKLQDICSILIVINAIAAFLLCGMPKFYKNEQNLIHKTLPEYGDGYRIFIVQTDIVLKDKDGNDVSVNSGTKLVRLNITEEAVVREIDDMKDESIIPLSLDLKYGTDVLYVTGSALEDKTKFSEITEQVMKEQNEQVEKDRQEGHKEYCQYVLKQRFWFVLVLLYPLHCLAGLIGLAISLIITKNIREKSKLKDTIAVTVLLLVIKIGAIIYFTVHPYIAYSPFQTRLPIPSFIEIFRTLFG